MTEERVLSPREEAELQARQEEKQRLAELQADADLRWVMEHREGQRFMWRLLGIAGLYRNPMQGDGDAFTNFRCGMQAVGQQVVAEIHRVCPERYFEMAREQQKRDDGNDAAGR